MKRQRSTNCRTCHYHHGQHNILCSIHPAGKESKFCPDHKPVSSKDYARREFPVNWYLVQGMIFIESFSISVGCSLGLVLFDFDLDDLFAIVTLCFYFGALMYAGITIFSRLIGVDKEENNTFAFLWAINILAVFIVRGLDALF